MPFSDSACMSSNRTSERWPTEASVARGSTDTATGSPAPHQEVLYSWVRMRMRRKVTDEMLPSSLNWMPKPRWDGSTSISSNTMPDILERLSEPILMAADLLLSVQLLTCNRCKGASGCVVFTTMASSPVSTVTLRITTSKELSISIPSVLGMSSSLVTRRFHTVTCWLLSTCTVQNGLSCRVTPEISTCEDPTTLIRFGRHSVRFAQSASCQL
mmetsp:Transcript_7259/g.21429  ORF Transcript_7259/g.21429 Transcript_7259/m.21429 type:complete len:214 (-) Transcript_7259:608-1249(-)